MDLRGWAATALSHDMIRTVGGGKPFLLMECSPSSSNWYPFMNLGNNRECTLFRRQCRPSDMGRIR